MTDKKTPEFDIWENYTNGDAPPLRPVDRMFPDAHRPIAIATSRCVSPPIGCGQKVKVDGFVDAISAKEYGITGLCQDCQDRMYSALADEEEADEGSVG